MIKYPTVQFSWASPIYCFKDEKHSSKKDELMTHVYDLKNQRHKSEVSELAKNNLFESQFDFFDSDLQVVQELKAFCKECLMGVVKDINQYDDDFMSNLVPVLHESWAHITNNNGYHDAHQHLNTSWGGIYYVNSSECGKVVDEDGITRMNGTNRFYSPIQYFLGDPSMRYLMKNIVDMNPIEGVLVLFPGYLLHSATPYTGKEDRIVISFNSAIKEIERRPIGI